MKPTVIRAPTLGEARRQAFEAIERAAGAGQDFARSDIKRTGGETVITIYWQEAEE